MAIATGGVPSLEKQRILERYRDDANGSPFCALLNDASNQLDITDTTTEMLSFEASYTGYSRFSYDVSDVAIAIDGASVTATFPTATFTFDTLADGEIATFTHALFCYYDLTATIRHFAIYAVNGGNAITRNNTQNSYEITLTRGKLISTVS